MMMVNRQLRIALLFSFLGHFFIMAFVSIVFFPTALKPRQYPLVNFLGPILSSPLLEPSPDTYRKQLVNFLAAVDIQKESYFTTGLYSSLLAEKKSFSPDEFIDVDSKEPISPFAGLTSTTGSSSQREAIFKPTFPQYPEWMHERQIGTVIFNVYISADGFVQEIVNVQTSSNPEIDTQLTRYIQGWRFAPVSGLQGQWQTVRLDLDFE